MRVPYSVRVVLLLLQRCVPVWQLTAAELHQQWHLSMLNGKPDAEETSLPLYVH
jgi:hypothetical protein